MKGLVLQQLRAPQEFYDVPRPQSCAQRFLEQLARSPKVLTVDLEHLQEQAVMAA